MTGVISSSLKMAPGGAFGRVILLRPDPSRRGLARETSPVASEERLNQRKTRAELRAWIAAARTSLIASLPCLSARLYGTSCEVKIVRHFPERPQDHRILEFADFRTSLPREGDRAGIRRVAAHHFSPPHGGRCVGTLDRFSGRQASLDTHERQRNRSSLASNLDAPTIGIKNKTRT